IRVKTFFETLVKPQALVPVLPALHQSLHRQLPRKSDLLRNVSLATQPRHHLLPKLFAEPALHTLRAGPEYRRRKELIPEARETTDLNSSGQRSLVDESHVHMDRE